MNLPRPGGSFEVSRLLPAVSVGLSTAVAVNVAAGLAQRIGLADAAMVTADSSRWVALPVGALVFLLCFVLIGRSRHFA